MQEGFSLAFGAMSGSIAPPILQAPALSIRRNSGNGFELDLQ